MTTVRSRLSRLEERHDADVVMIEALHRLLDVKLDGLGNLMESKFLTFRAYVDSESDRIALAMSAADKAITKAEIATDKRFDAVNEFRAQLADQAGAFVTREAFDAQVRSVTTAITVSNEAMRDRLTVLERASERSQGRGAGLQAGWGYIVTAMGLALTVATLVIIFTRK